MVAKIATQTKTPTRTPTARPRRVRSTEGTYEIARSGRSAESTNSRLAYDGDPSTAWSVDGSSRRTFVWFDLGDEVSVSSLRWLLSDVSPGLTVTIDVSADRRTWEAVGTVTDLVVGDWQTIETDAQARYVRLSLSTEDDESTVFSLAEIEFAG